VFPVPANSDQFSDTQDVDRIDEALALITKAVTDRFPGRIAMTSSFGSSSAVLLDLVARVDPTIPVLFLNTRKLFGETLRYRDALVDRLDLTDVRELTPDPVDIAVHDADGMLFRSRPDLCCHLRKTLPLNRALAGFDAWLTGRRRDQSDQRTALKRVERADRRVKINPLADWSQDDVDDYMDRRGLPRHPLEADGFLSIGCMPCTDRVAPGEDSRAGRWRGFDKTECGIHSPVSPVSPISVSGVSV
jgi:phosphoadenosine phosphosulfate reductase